MPDEINLLQNPWFRGEFIRYNSTLLVAPGWVFGHDPAYGPQPELTQEVWNIGAGRVYPGGPLPAKAQKGFTRWNKVDWWLAQQVPAVRGRWYLGEAWIWPWGSEGDDPNHSTGAKMWERVGIHPWGAVEPLSWATVYGTPLQEQYDRWIRFRVYSQAEADRIAFVVNLKNEVKVSHVDWYVGYASLVEVAGPGEGGGEEPPPPPEETYPTIPEIEEAARRAVRAELGAHKWVPTPA